MPRFHILFPFRSAISDSFFRNFPRFESVTNSLEPLSIPACPKLTRRRTLKQRWSFIDRRGEFIRLLKPWRTKRFRYLSTRCFVRPALFMRVSDIQEVPRYLSRLGTFKRFALSATSRTSLRNFTEETRAFGSWKYLEPLCVYSPQNAGNWRVSIVFPFGKLDSFYFEISDLSLSYELWLWM